MKRVYLSLGSNVGNRAKNLSVAIEKMSHSGVRICRVSPVYETEPVDYTAQPWFLNLVVEADTELFPMQLLARTSRIERTLGRVRTVSKGPRTIDIDILLYGNSIIGTEDLQIPHPRMTERRFVLAPLADLAPALLHPVRHETVRDLLASAPAQIVRQIPA